MSAEELSKLTIGDTMVTTRAGAARARTAPPQSPEDQESPLSSPPSSSTPSMIETSEGQKYDVSTFTEDLRKRAKRGLLGDNNISMKLCKEIEGSTKRYIFHLDDDITVAMDGDHAPKCSCGTNEGGKACKHVFWMLGQLTSTAPKNHPFQLAEDGSSVRDMHPSEIINRFTLEKIADNLNWVYQEDQLPDQDQMLDEIANMLSVFEPTDALPGEFKSDETADLSEESRKYREFKDLLGQHAILNPALFIQMQEIIPPEFQVQVFFDKIMRRVDRTFTALDEYIARGPTNTQSEALDVRRCAARLRGFVRAVHDYYHNHVEEEGEVNAPTIGVRAVAALVRILDGVTERNYDAYTAITWGAMPPTDPKDQNLFVCLIGTSAEGQGMFALDTLLTLPGEDVLRNYEGLYEVEQRLRATPYTPPAYADAFRTLIHDKRKRAAEESGGSSAKRPTME